MHGNVLISGDYRRQSRLHLSRIASKVANNVIATLPHQPTCTAFVSAVDLKRVAAKAAHHRMAHTKEMFFEMLFETFLAAFTQTRAVVDNEPGVKSNFGLT